MSWRYRQVIHDSTEARDFFVSYTGVDVAWAEWIAWQLEADGYTVVLQAWDFLPGTNFPLEMHNAAATARRTLAVLSPDYLSSDFAQPEWAAAFKKDPTGAGRRLLTVRVRPCDPPGLLGPIVYVDLVDCDPEQARKRLLTTVRDRLKPAHEPDFPLSDAPPFPASSLALMEVGVHASRAGKLSAKSLVQHGRRRTAYPLDLSLAQLVEEDLVVGTRITPQGGRKKAEELNAADVAARLVSGRSCLLLGEPGAG